MKKDKTTGGGFFINKIINSTLKSVSSFDELLKDKKVFAVEVKEKEFLQRKKTVLGKADLSRKEADSRL